MNHPLSSLLLSIFVISQVVSGLHVPSRARFGGGPLAEPPGPPINTTNILRTTDVVPAPHPADVVPDRPISEPLPDHVCDKDSKDCVYWKSGYLNMPTQSRIAITDKDRVGPMYGVESAPRLTQPPKYITIRLPDGSSITVEGTTKLTPATLLTKINASHKNYPEDQFELMYKEKVLEKSVPLEKQKVLLDIPLVLRPIPLAVLELADGTTLVLEGLPNSASVGELKRTVEQLHNLPVHRQVWRLNGKELDDEKTLSDQGVLLGQKLSLSFAPNIKVHRVATGDVLQFSIPVGRTVETLKSLIEQEINVPIALQVLRFLDKTLDDSHTLEEEGIPVWASLELDVLPTLKIQLPDDEPLPIFNVALTDTLQTVKEKLKGLQSTFNPAEFKCSHQRSELKDSVALARQGVTLGSTLVCTKKPAIVVNYKDKSYPLSLGYHSTLDDVKRAIEKEVYVPVAQQILLYNGREIDETDSKSLEALKIPFSSILTLERKPALTLVLPNGATLFVPELVVGAPVMDIVTFVANALSLSASDILLFSKGRQLLPEKPWELQDITMGDTLYVVEAKTLSGPTIQKAAPLQVLFPGKLFSLHNVSPSDLPSVVKQAASTVSGRRIDALYLGSKLLDDSGGSLAQQGVPMNAVLFASGGEKIVKKGGVQKTDVSECNFDVHGEECYKDPETALHYAMFEKRVMWVMIVYGVLIFTLALFIQSIISLLTIRVVKSRDRFVREFLETAFRSLTVVALSLATIDIVLNFDIFEYKVEALLFHTFDDVTPQLGITENVLKVTFNKMYQIAQFFLAAYLVLVLFVAATARGFSQWLSKMDRIPVNQIVGSEKQEASTSLVHYALLRYEFSDSVEVMAVKGLDPEFYNFMEYFRTCLLVSAIKLIRIPYTVLIVGAFSMFLINPVARFRYVKMLIVMLSLLLGVLIVLGLVFLRALSIKKKLIPRNPLSYLRLRYNYQLHEAPLSEAELEEVGPCYKYMQLSRTTKCCTCWVRFFYGTRYPNKHEALFWFWRRGPYLLECIFEMALFFGLCVVAHTFYLINKQWEVWAVRYGVWPLLVFIVMICLGLAAIPVILWTLTISNYTSGLVRDNILSEVWEVQRSETVRRMAQLIDALRIEATLFDIGRAGEGFLKKLKQRTQAVSQEVATENETVFNDLDDDEDGQINLPQLYTFLTRQGLNITSEDEARKWFVVFDTDNSGGIDRDEFDVIISVAKQLTQDTLDIASVQNLLTTKFKLDSSDPGAINVPVLAKLVKALHIHRSWSYNRFVHLIEFISGQRGARTLTIEQFTSGLKRIEQETIGTLTQAVGELKGWNLDVIRGDSGREPLP